jgi:hypothetical protein
MGTITILAMETNQQEAQGKASSQQPALAGPASVERFSSTLIFPLTPRPYNSFTGSQPFPLDIPDHNGRISTNRT